MMRRISLLALPCALSLFTCPLRAETPAHPAAGPAPAPAPSAASADAATKAEAAQRFDRGLSLFNEGDNAGALAEFKQTYALMPNKIVLFNIGLVYAAMARPVEAVDALGTVVDSAALSAEQRERAQKTLADQQARIGRVSVVTVPAGARIDVDGVEVARTPLSEPLRVAEGSHVIGAVAEGYAHARKEILVAGNADASVSFELLLSAAKRPANLTIRSRIRDAEVLLDGSVVGKTPLASSLAVPAGPHRIELRRPGYRTGNQAVDVGEGATADVTLDLPVDAQALPSEGADLALQLREGTADLTIDDEHRGLYSQPLRLPKGAHHVRVQVAGYLPFEQDVTLQAGQSLVLSPFLLPTPETRKAHDDNVRLHRTWGFIGLGAGAAVIGASVAFTVNAHSEKHSAQQDFDANEALVLAQVGDCKQGAPDLDQCNARVLDAQARVNSAANKVSIGFVGMGVGAAVAATGAILLLTGESVHRFDPPAAAKASPGRGLALLPGPGQLGLALGGAF